MILEKRWREGKAGGRGKEGDNRHRQTTLMEYTVESKLRSS